MLTGLAQHPQEPGVRRDLWGSRGLLLLLTVTALLLRLPGMGESLWLDETFMTRIKVGETLTLMRTLLSDIHPPAYLTLMHFWIGLFGDSELSVRMLPLLSGVLSIPILYELGRRLAGPKAGFFAATLLALSPTHIWYSHEARPYATVILMVLLTTLACYRMADPALHGKALRRWTWVWSASLAFALFTHYYIIALWAAFTFLPWFAGHARRKRMLIIGLTLGITFGTGLYLKSLLSPIHTIAPYLRPFTAGEFYDLHFNWFLTGNSFTPRMGARSFEDLLLLPYSMLGLACVLLGLYRLLLGDLRKSSMMPGWLLVLLWLALPALLFLLPFVGFTNSYIERSALPALPFFYLCLAFGLTAPSRPWSRYLTNGIAAILLLILLLCSFQNREAWTVYKPRPDWRQASVWLDKELGEAQGDKDAVRDLYAQGFDPYALSYYDDRFQMAKHFEPNTGAYKHMQAALNRFVDSKGALGAWLSKTLETSFLKDQKALDQLRKKLRLRIHDLDNSDPRARTGADKTADFYLLTWPDRVEREPRIKALLQDPSLEILSRQDFRLLSLIHIRPRNQ